MAKLGYNSDSPVSDLKGLKLGRQECVEALRDVITTVEPPFTLGIYGPWGSGKTSLMQGLKDAVAALNEGDEPTYHTLFFRPWKYQTSTGVWRGLISLMFDEFRRIEGFLTFKGGGKAIKQGMRGMLNMVGSFAGTGNVGDTVARVGALDPEFRNAFEEQFRCLLNEYIDEGSRLVVFIDDLDRCLPEIAVALLEALKLYCDESRCIFVIGIDDWIVQKGIQVIYGDKLEMDGRDYLQKMIQVAFVIPEPEETELKAFVEGLVPKSVTGKAKRAAITDMVCRAMGGNPRQIKRFFNTLILTQALAKAGKAELDPAILAKVLILQLQWPDFYRDLPYHLDWAKMEREVLGATLLGTGCERSCDRHRHITLGEFLDDVGPSLKKLSETKLLPYFRYVQRSGVDREEVGPTIYTPVADPIACITDSDLHVRLAGIITLRDQPDPRTVEHLVPLLDDDAPLIRMHAADALGRVGGSRAVAALIDHFDDRVGEVRGRVAEALGRIGDDRGVEALTIRLRSVDEYTRRSALGGLAHTSNKMIVRRLLSRDALGRPPWLDPQIPVTQKRVESVANVNRCTKEHVREQYEALIEQFGDILTLEWITSEES